MARLEPPVPRAVSSGAGVTVGGPGKGSGSTGGCGRVCTACMTLPQSLMGGLPWRSHVSEPQPPPTLVGTTRAGAWGAGGEPHVVSRAPGLGVAWSSLVSPLRGWAGACPVACSGASFSDGASGVWPYIYFGLFASCFLDFISCRLNCSTFLLRGQQTTLFKDQFSQSPRCLSDELLCHFHC